MSSNTGDASDMNPYARTGLDLLAKGFSRFIDVQTVRAVQGTNTNAILQNDGMTIATGATPVYMSGMGRNPWLLPLMAVGGIYLLTRG